MKVSHSRLSVITALQLQLCSNSAFVLQSSSFSPLSYFSNDEFPLSCFENDRQSLKRNIFSRRTILRSALEDLTQFDADPSKSKIESSLSTSFDTIANARYACTRFLRNPTPSNSNSNSSDTITTTTTTTTNKNIPTGTTPNPKVLQKAKDALSISRRAPSGFNAQPYRAILVSDPILKSKVSKYCLGRNADRVRDSDCTVVFVADCQCTRDFPKLKSLLLENHHSQNNNQNNKKKKPLTNFMLRKIQILIALFSSGYPLPRIFSNFISYCIRCVLTLVGIITRHKILLPSLATAETWGSKNTMLFAMTYMLSCSSKQIVTCPMEGFQARGIKRVLGVPGGGRFKIPLIVSTGLPYHKGDGEGEERDKEDDAGMTHGSGGGSQGRFALEDVVFENGFRS